MANNLRVFNTNSEYQSADLVHPAVSYVIETDKVHYEPTTPTPSFKWKATYSDSHTESAECNSSSAIGSTEITKANLVSVEIGDCVTSIGGSAFSGTNLTSINIPSGVTSIGNDAFFYCRSLTSITIPDSVTSIGQSAFNNCNKLSRVNSNTNGVFNIPSGITILNSSVFNSCKCVSVNIPSGITTIGSTVFQNAKSLTNVTVNAITPPTMGVNVFQGCSNLANIYVPDVDAYKAASGWSEYASRIYPIP